MRELIIVSGRKYKKIHQLNHFVLKYLQNLISY